MAGTIIGALAPERGPAGRRLVSAERLAGPASYATGGFTTTVLFGTVDSLLVVPEDSNYGLHASLTTYATVFSVSGSTITVKVYVMDVTAASQATWAELSATTDLSSLYWRVEAIGH